jgi:hypothetical protein
MVIAGALAAGRGEPGFHAEDPRDLGLFALAVLMCGPFGTGFSQSINDYIVQLGAAFIVGGYLG